MSQIAATSYEIVRTFRIDAGHRIFGHEGKCKNLHGHSYQFDVYVRPDNNELDDIGRAIDFGVIKERIGTWLDENWDHGMILHARDPLAILLQNVPETRGDKLFLLPYSPTAENLAAFLLHKANGLMRGTGIRVTKVICHETPNCYAIATPKE